MGKAEQSESKAKAAEDAKTPSSCTRAGDNHGPMSLIRPYKADGAFLGPSWPISSSFGSLFGPSWGHLGPFKGILGPSWSHLGPSWGILGPSWGHLGPSWGHLGASWGHIGTILGHLRPSWDHLEKKRCPSFWPVKRPRHLGPFWGPFWGPKLALFW